jgi:hypothetical protein
MAFQTINILLKYQMEIDIANSLQTLSYVFLLGLSTLKNAKKVHIIISVLPFTPNDMQIRCPGNVSVL